MAALAVSTTTIRLGPLVDCVCYRSPALLARQAADVDRLSGGRLILGIGCGWVEPEFGWLSLPFPPARQRQEMLAEAIDIIHGLWGIAVGSADAPDRSFRDPILGLEGPPPLAYHGEHYRLDGGLIRLGPIQSPRVPVMIAGAGERVTLRQVARYADAANIGLDATPGATRTVAEIRHKLAVLRRHCEEVGRPYESILVTHFTNPVLLAESSAALAAKRDRLPATYRNAEGLFGTPDDALAFFQPLVDAGVRYFITHLTTYDDLETAQLLATKVIPALRTPASAG
jgi:alkanesulfonate monooxygenase SsuD/methylene tetrahydromethanopterin reductase-like flavin-dependent oxidoreductase (luciferase family)